jgi:hypothetical protein
VRAGGERGVPEQHTRPSAIWDVDIETAWMNGSSIRSTNSACGASCRRAWSRIPANSGTPCRGQTRRSAAMVGENSFEFSAVHVAI